LNKKWQEIFINKCNVSICSIYSNKEITVYVVYYQALFKFGKDVNFLLKLTYKISNNVVTLLLELCPLTINKYLNLSNQIIIQYKL